VSDELAMTEAAPNHPKVEELRALSLGQLTEAELAPVLAHLGECPACCRRIDELAAADPLPPRPVVHRVRSIGVEREPLRSRGSAPPSSSAATASAHRLRTALCSGEVPFLSSAFGSAPAASRMAMLSRCAVGSHSGDPGPPSTA